MSLLGAALLFLRATKEAPSYQRLLLPLSGALFGFAVGVRLTLAPAALAFTGMLIADIPQSRSGRMRTAVVFAAGMAVGIAPTVFMFAMDCRPFLAGNFVYPALNTAFRQATAYKSAMTPAAKLIWFLERILGDPGICAMAIVLVGSLFLLWRRGAFGTHPLRRELTFLGLLMRTSVAAASFRRTAMNLSCISGDEARSVQRLIQIHDQVADVFHAD